MSKDVFDVILQDARKGSIGSMWILAFMYASESEENHLKAERWLKKLVELKDAPSMLVWKKYQKTGDLLGAFGRR